MPLVGERALKSIVYLYPSQDDAVNGAPTGATAFLLSIPGVQLRADASGVVVDEPGPESLYVVTAFHNLSDERETPPRPGALWLRVSRTIGPPEVISTALGDWQHDADHDLSVLPLDVEKTKDLDLEAAPMACLVGDPRHLPRMLRGVLPGEEVFMIGRFIGHDGLVQNEPIVRFGNVAMLPGPPVTDNLGRSMIVYLVEMRSQGGFSGAPVFVHIPASHGLKSSAHSYLMGVDVGHFPIDLEVRRKGSDTAMNEIVATDASAMATVTPVSHLLDLLNVRKLVDMRRKATEAWKNRPTPEPES